MQHQPAGLILRQECKKHKEREYPQETGQFPVNGALSRKKQIRQKPEEPDYAWQ